MTVRTPTQLSLLNQLLRSLLFSLGMLVSIGICAPLVVLGFPLPFVRRYRLSQYWTRFNIWWLRVTCRIDYRLSGIEHIPNRPVVVMAKHQSTWETLFLHQYLPPVAWVIKRELLWIPFFGWGLAMVSPISIDRTSGVRALKQMIEQGKDPFGKGNGITRRRCSLSQMPAPISLSGYNLDDGSSLFLE